MLKLIEEIWERDPDLRLSQLLVNAIRPATPVPEVFYCEDDKLVEGLRKFAELQRRPGEDQTPHRGDDEGARR